jgi:broad specificity phosphatase PhoE
MLLLRHGESVWNALGRWQGWADPPLSPEGERQAVTAGRRLRPIGFTAAVASDLRRARRTAELAAEAIGLGGPVQIDAGLREYDVGHWSGMTGLEIESRWPGCVEDWQQGRLVAIPGGEIRDTFVARIAAAVTRVGATHPDGVVLVITHGGVISALERSIGADQGRLAYLGGRWLEASGEGLDAGEAVFLFDPDADAEAPGTARPRPRPARAERFPRQMAERRPRQALGPLPSGW